MLKQIKNPKEGGAAWEELQEVRETGRARTKGVIKKQQGKVENGRLPGKSVQ
jgi:hypothetical protein